MSEIKIIIQARTGSTRLPQKMILPFYEENGIFSLILKRLTSAINIEDIILATSTNVNNDVLEDIARSYGVNCFRGSENDVLQRFIDAANKFNAAKIIRVCADNPFLDVDYLNFLIDNFKKSDCDYMSFMTSKGTPTIKTHYGFWAEAVTLNALEKVKSMTDENLYHEHVTNFIYANPNDFNIKFFNIPEEIDSHDDIRLTIDTKVDFDIQKEIFNVIYKKNPSFNASDVVAFLNENQQYMKIMRDEILKNQK
ncbi:MAG: glycosyltransferase family protein [Bacteroidales bacterium]|nr:glycosyltransferase family protein [Bacteroidales bacterium]